MNCFPFTSAVTFDDEGLPIYDRAADSSLLRRVFARYFSDGVFYNPSTSLNVTSDGGLAIKVDSGACHIQGATLDEKNITNIVLSQGGSQDRIDTVVARLDLTLTVNDIHIDLLQGTEASAPSAPTLTRNATVWELGLANIYVKANSQSVSSLNITDTRLDTTRCGVVAQTVKPIDTEPYFLQLQTAIDYLKTLIETTISGAAPNGFFYYLHTYSEQTKIHNFIPTDDGTGATGAGTNGKALITAQFSTGDTFSVNGKAVAAYTGEDETDELHLGRWMTFTFDGEQINFNGGGSGLNLKIITATSEGALPSVAKENTVAIITTTAIAKTTFAVSRPTSPIEGQVFIDTGMASFLPINVSKNKAIDITVYPNSCVQYVGGSWVARLAFTYKNGAWVSWRQFVYYRGEQYPNITGGWTGQAGSGAVTFYTDNMYLYSPGGSNSRVYIRTVGRVDLTNYRRLVFNSSCVSHRGVAADRLFFSVNTTGEMPTGADPSVAAYYPVTATTAGDFTVDISGVSGLHYLYIWCYGFYASTYEVYLE